MPQILTHVVNSTSGADGQDGLTTPGGRLTLATGDPLPTADQTAKTTVYYTPYLSGYINLFDSTDWVRVAFTEKSVSVPATTSTPFDVFGYLNAGDLALETVNWTNDTTRATALVRQNGFWAKSGATTRLYLGTCRTTGTSQQCEDSQARRLVWNAYNRVERPVIKTSSATGYTYSTNAFRAVNSDTAFRFDMVCGLDGHAWMSLYMMIFMTNTVATFVASCGIGEGSTTVSTSKSPVFEIGVANAGIMVQAALLRHLPLGYQYYQALERGAGSGTQTWFNGNDRGLFGWIMA